jgi:hypothetical protein
LAWWREALKGGHSRDDAEFATKWNEVRQFIGVHGDVLDIGCGPRPPFAPCTVIDPLANKYREMTPRRWWRDVTVYAQPAEVALVDLQQKFDTVICWNCLDHTIGWKTILASMWWYARHREGTRVGIATDFYPPFDGHPGFDRAEFTAEVAQQFHVLESREPFGRQLALVMVPV